MIFTSIHPTTGATERRQHVPYVVRQRGDIWEAFDKRNSRLIGRSYTSANDLRRHMDTVTEPAKEA